MAWRAYLGWECSNPQKLPLPDLLARVALAHEQALMHLRHYPDVSRHKLACTLLIRAHVHKQRYAS